MDANQIDLSLSRSFSVVKHLYYQGMFLIRVPDSSKNELLDTNCLVHLTILEENFCLRHKASIELPLNINTVIMYEAMKQFQDYTTDVIKHLDYISCCCSCFVNPAPLKHISETHLIIMAAFNIDILY